MTDSLVIGESIELIGSVASTNPLCTGAVFLLQPGYDLSAPQPVTSIVGSLLLDGSRPFGYQAGNRTITLPIEISVPGDSGTPAGFATLIAAREVLLREINQQTWTLRWTRDPGAGGTALPLLFDCFRAHASVVEWGGVDQLNRFPIGLVTISFDALPYGRTDVPVVVDFPSPLAGRTAPPAAVNIDTFSSVSGTQWAASTQSPVSGGQSAFWDPSITPAFMPTGVGVTPTYTKGSLAVNLAAGWSAVNNATGTTTTFVVSSATAITAGIDVGDQFQLWTSAPALIQTQIFTVTAISPVVPGGGNVTVTYTPASLAAPVSTNSAIQTGPPSLNAVTFWAGFGSTAFYPNWSRLGGRIVFALTLTDTYSTTLSFSKTVKCAGTNNSLLPRWNKIRMPVPYKAGFDYANVASYTITVTNRGTNDLRFTQLYLSALQGVPPPVAVSAASARGTVYELSGLPGTARAPVSLQFQQAGSKAYTRNLTVQGAGTWVCPPGVSSVGVFCIGAGGNGSGNSGSQAGGGGGGGGSANNGAVAVTAGNVYNFTVGKVSAYGPGGNGGNTSFTGDSVTVTANGGTGGTISAGGAGGAAAGGGFAGGTGGAGVAGTNSGGGGGGGSGGGAAGGNNGAAGSGGSGGAGGAAVAGGGNGGKGGSHTTATNGAAPTIGYGGGGGGGPQPGRGGFGAGGLIVLTYTATLPAFQTLLVHRPPPDSPHQLIPFVSPDPADTPNGSIQYPVGSLFPGVPARFAGTYTVVMGVWAWNNPSASRTLTVTVTQAEQVGGATYTASASTSVIPNNLPSCPGTNATVGPLVTVGEITLPIQEMPQDNLNAYFTVSVTSTNTSDQFMDVIFLDTMGSTVIIQSATAYASMYLDEPASDRDLGLILGSLFDRGDAVSVLDRAVVAGGPISVDPDGNSLLLGYCAEGAPNLQMTYHPRWHLDRIQ